MHLSHKDLFPVRDHYRDTLEIDPGRLANDVGDLAIDLVGPGGRTMQLFSGDDPNDWFDLLVINGTWDGEQLPAGRYTIHVVAADRAGNTTEQVLPFHIDDRQAVRKTYTATIPAARTLADSYVGSCSRLGAAVGRSWKGSLGLYSSSCAAKNGSTVITVHGAQVPKSVRGFVGPVTVSTYGGAARGASAAYIVHGWLRASDNEFIKRSQYDGRLGAHQATAYPANVVRTIDGKKWVYWQLGLSEGSRYDVKSFTIKCTYYGLVAPRSRTASDAKTIAEPSGAPGPGYTPPKTDAAELLAAYSPGM